MKEIVQIFLHLRDSKGWEKTIAWNADGKLPHHYRLKKMPNLKKMSLTLNVDSPPAVIEDEQLIFQLYREQFEPLTERFYHLHGFYEEV